MSQFDTGIPNIRVVIREARDENAFIDVPNLVVKVERSPDYNVNIIPSTQVILRTGSFFNIADLALNAISSSYALTASYAENISDFAAFPYTGSAEITGSLQITGSLTVENIVQSREFKLSAGDVSITFTGSINTGIFGISEYIQPFISTHSFSGASIEYIAQRPGATRMGIIMATWAAGSTLVFTDISTADVGDTSDISFIFLPSGSYYRLRVNSSGSGSGTWTVQSLFKLFPNLNS
jgi:hypothetical protein